MSETAITWAKAQDVRGADGKPDRNAKDVLVYLATYADAYGEAWAAVDLLAFEMSVDPRHVQRGLKAVRCKPGESGFVEETGRWHFYQGKRYPIYQLRLDQGPSSSLRAFLANRQSGVTPVSPQDQAEGAPDQARGDTGVTPEEPRGDTGVTPRGDTGATLIGNSIGEGETNVSPSRPEPRDGGLGFWETFDALLRSAPGPMIAKSKPRDAKSEWSRVFRRHKAITPADLLAAMKAYAGNEHVRSRIVLDGLETWLGKDMFLPWLRGADEAAAAVEAALAPILANAPGDVRELMLSRGEAWARSWLHEAEWDEARQTVIVKTTTAADAIRGQLRLELKTLNVKVMSRMEREFARQREGA